MTTGTSGSPTSSPYATGGGGTRLEHQYGATLLAALLTGDPIAELGDDVAPRSVRFQAGSISPVDDLVVESNDGGAIRRVSIGVRRAPNLTRSDEDSVPLLRSYLRVVLEHWPDVASGQWRLALAVASPNPAVRQLKELAVVAVAAPDAVDFRARVAQPGLVNGTARDRLGHLDALVTAAASGLETDAGVSGEELTWRLLSVLRVRELRLEGVDESDRTQAVRSLRSVTGERTAAAADALFARLAELTGRYAPASARVTELTLRRDLVGSPLRRSPTYAQAWALLDRLGERLREWTRTDLREGETRLELDRASARASLVHVMAATGAAGALVVTGEPDVGKSALTLRAAEHLATGGAAVTTMGLRDLPPTLLELETGLGAPLSDVLAGGPTSDLRLLVLDGAEAALEGRASLLQEIALAALRAGLGVVAVTRTGGARRVREILASAAHPAGTTPPQEHIVAPLTDAEARQLTQTFPALSRLGNEERSRWLLGRPGLVDLLLQSGVVPAPADLLSEADVFAAVWDGLVRNHEQAPPGEATPDQREAAMTALAQRELVRSSQAAPDPAVLPRLRTAGLLKTGGLPAAWRTGEEFASDLVRDFAVTRLLLTDGWQALVDADAPRWAIRAVRLACQVALRTGGDLASTWRDLQAQFGGLASRFGQRWSEVPLEAVLTLGDEHALTEVWELLESDGGAKEATLVRLALQRYTNQGIGDPAVLGPVVALAFDDDDVVLRRRWPSHRDDDPVGELVLSWLRGLIRTGARPISLRQRIRDIILATEPDAYDEFAVEAVATLGPDLNEDAEAFLRRVANAHGYHLWPAVETHGAILGMTAHQPHLMLELAEAYYVDHDDRNGWDLDMGIRHHRGGPVTPQVAWYYGPFWWLLNRVPADALALINRMLDHAAKVRVRGDHDAAGGESDTSPPGLDLELPDHGLRRCVGDEHVWAWYRGSSVGPYPCMSALLAVERFADQLIAMPGIPIDRVLSLLLRDCHNLAMPGLVVGILVRHLERADDLLDPWLARPEIWQLEFSRVTNEGVLHVQGPDVTTTAGRDRRQFSLREVAAQMTLRAALGGDQDRLTKLAAVGDELVCRAQSILAGVDGAAEQLASIEGWAAAFRPENYRAERTDDGLVFQYEHPEPVAAALAADLAELGANHEALRLQNTYASAEDRAAPVDTLIDDIALARKLADAPPAGGPLFAEDPIAAVAAAAVVAHARGKAEVPNDDLRWAADVLLAAAAHPQADSMSYPGTVYPRGADRSAAAALPLFLQPALDGVHLNHARIAQGLAQCATSLYDEVRIAFVLACEPVWTSPCDASGGHRCRHQLLWYAAEAGLRDARLGAWDMAAQRRMPEPISPPYGPTLAATATDSLRVNRLVPPLAAAASARDAVCVAADADQLLGILLAAHRRGADHWARKGYDHHQDRQRQLMARVLVTLFVKGDPGPLTEHIRLFTNSARTLVMQLRDLAQLFTYDDRLCPHLCKVWRHVLTTALDAVDAGADLLGDPHWADWAIGALLPTPQISVADPDPDATLRHARARWIAPESIAGLVARWLPMAHGEPKAVDAVACLAKCGPLSWQVTTGLMWAEQVVDDRYDSFANRCWHLPEWLAEVREAGLATSDDTARWRRLVDGLAAAGDRRAAELQRLEE